MSKYVKELEIKQLRRTFDGVTDVVVLKTAGLSATATTSLRAELRKKGYHLRVVKNSLAKQVFGASGLGGASSLLEGASTVAWGGPGIVELAKEISDWAKKIKELEVKGACVSGQVLGSAGVEALSKLPSRQELLGRIVQLVQSPGARLAALLQGPGGMLASQIKSIAEGSEGEAAAEPAAAS